MDDTRLFHKIGQSLANSKGYEVHIIAFPSVKDHTNHAIRFHTFKRFGRLSFYRLLVPWMVFRKSLSLKPDILIITTHELLLPGILLKTISGAKVVYDIQENYFRNILFLPSFPLLVRPFLAAYVRVKEVIFSVFADHFFLAEASYRKELSFLRDRFTILENKVKRPAHLRQRPRNDSINLLFSGTLEETTGVFIAMELAKKLHSQDRSVKLTIIGYCTKPSVLEKIKEAVNSTDFISLMGGDSLVPHEEIITAIEQSSAGIIAYHINASTADRIPTKLYEYLGYKLPILIVNHAPWVSECARYEAGIVFDPMDIGASKILHELKNRRFYPHFGGEELYWDTEESKLFAALSSI